MKKRNIKKKITIGAVVGVILFALGIVADLITIDESNRVNSIKNWLKNETEPVSTNLPSNHTYTEYETEKNNENNVGQSPSITDSTDNTNEQTDSQPSKNAPHYIYDTIICENVKITAEDIFQCPF